MHSHFVCVSQVDTAAEASEAARQAAVAARENVKRIRHERDQELLEAIGRAKAAAEVRAARATTQCVCVFFF